MREYGTSQLTGKLRWVVRKPPNLIERVLQQEWLCLNDVRSEAWYEWRDVSLEYEADDESR